MEPKLPKTASLEHAEVNAEFISSITHDTPHVAFLNCTSKDWPGCFVALSKKNHVKSFTAVHCGIED